MKTKLLKGERWDNLQVVEIESNPVKVKLGDGAYYNKYMIVLVLMCDCTNTIRIDLPDFKGKRRMKDCGCGMSKQLRAGIRVDVVRPVRVHKAKYGWLKVLAFENDASMSQVVRDLVSRGLDEGILRYRAQEKAESNVMLIGFTDDLNKRVIEWAASAGDSFNYAIGELMRIGEEVLREEGKLKHSSTYQDLINQDADAHRVEEAESKGYGGYEAKQLRFKGRRLDKKKPVRNEGDGDEPQRSGEIVLDNETEDD